MDQSILKTFCSNLSIIEITDLRATSEACDQAVESNAEDVEHAVQPATLCLIQSVPFKCCWRQRSMEKARVKGVWLNRRTLKRPLSQSCITQRLLHITSTTVVYISTRTITHQRLYIPHCYAAIVPDLYHATPITCNNCYIKELVLPHVNDYMYRTLKRPFPETCNTHTAYFTYRFALILWALTTWTCTVGPVIIEFR